MVTEWRWREERVSEGRRVVVKGRSDHASEGIR